jgi:formylglycine-generating enzyme required for sulfatase activity
VHAMMNFVDRDLRSRFALAAASALALLGSACSQPATTSQAASSAAPAGPFTDCSDCPMMATLPAGEFMMGEPGNPSRAPRAVTMASFAVSQAEITFANWDKCVASGGCAAPGAAKDWGWGRGDRPVINVSWKDANDYVNWLSQATGKQYRLPTKAEWEYAARAVTSTSAPSTLWAFGDDAAKLGEYAWYKDNSEGKSQPVRGKAPNLFGLYDMHGNVWEWVQDCADSSAANSCSSHLAAGGGLSSPPLELRSSNQVAPATERAPDVGFRVARSL